MTQAEWIDCANPEPMLEFIRDKVSSRTLRLFAVACCRSIWPLLGDERSRLAVDAAEQYANGELSAHEREKAHRDAGDAFQAAKSPACRDACAPRTPECAAARAALLCLMPDPLEAAAAASYQAANAARRVQGCDFLVDFAQVRLRQVGLLRELLGNPFRPVAFDAKWRTATAIALADGIYEERAFDRLPILGDALEEAGCDDADILTHCQSDGAHVRGCWVVDLVLGKG
jgi:hypothetical protein